MVSKNNYSEKMRKIRPQKQRFSIRKFTVGAASVLIGLTFMGINNQEVQADTTVAPEESVKVESSTASDITEKIESVVNTEDQSVSTANQAEVMSVEENNEVENDGTASGETGNEEVKNDRSISAVETNNVEEQTTNEAVTYNAESINGDTAVKNQNTNTTETNLVENTTPVEEAQAVEDVEKNAASVDVQPVESVESNTVSVEETQPAEKVENNTVSVEADQPIEAETKVENEASPIEESVVKENTTIQSNAKEVQSKAAVTILGTDADNYPKKAGDLIGDNRYIYQILNLNGTSFVSSDNKKLILSVNRNNLSDDNLYAYVTDNSFTEILSTHTIQAGHFKNIEVVNGWHTVKFLVVNSGKSNISINGSETPVGNASTVVGSTRIEYCLGNSTSIDASSIGEIIPVYTEQSVIKYYYNQNGNLIEIPDTDKYPNVNVSGWTGQGFIVDNVDQYKQLINGFYLDASKLPTGSFTGTLSQFGDGSYYKKVYYSAGDKDEGTIDQLKVDFTVVYRQIDAIGKMEVLMYDGKDMTKVIESHTVEAGKSVNFSHNNYTARNPFVTDSAHEVQFVYKELGSLILVDENGKEIHPSVKFNNDKDDPTKAGLTYTPVIEGYIADIEFVTPEDPGKDIKVVYRLREDAKATITIVDLDNLENNGGKVAELNATGKVYSVINFVDLSTTLQDLIDRGYVVISNDFKPGTKFDVKDLEFKIELKHGLEEINESQSVDKIINYVDGVGNKLHDSVTQTAIFKTNGYRDKVTGKIVEVTEVEHDDGYLIAIEITNKDASLQWTSKTDVFESIKSPDIVGYTTTQKWSTADKVDQDVKHRVENIVYDKKAQVGTITFWDETSNKQLGSTINIAGNYREVINYQIIENVLNSIKDYENNNYILVSNPLTYATTFGDAEYNPGCNDFRVILKHKIAENTQNKEVNRVITYVYADGPNKGQEAANSVTQKVTFIGTGQYDFVDKAWIGDIVWTTEAGDMNYTFAPVESPKVTGYGADRGIVEAKIVSGSSDNITEEVLYYANQTGASIQYIDDVTGLVIGRDDVYGKVDHQIIWGQNHENVLNLFIESGYKFVSSDYEFGKDYYYSADEAKNIFTVHLTRDVIIIDPTNPDSPAYGSEDYIKEVIQEIQYVFANGDTAAESNKQSIKFTAYGVVDKTTGKYVVLDENGKIVVDENKQPIEGTLTWKADVTDPKFAEVVSPTINGYTPNKDLISASSVTENTPNKVIVVTYTANAAKAEIIYVDETTGKQLETAVVDGKYNDTINYSTADKIKYYESLGYELVKDSYVGGEFSEDTKTFYVTFKHGVVHVHPDNPGKPGENINPGGDVKYPTDSGVLNKDVTHTVHYIYADGTTAKPSHTQTLTFTGSGHINKVTGEYVEVDEEGNIKLDSDGKPIPGKLNWMSALGNSFLAVPSPIITGHTPSHTEINGVENVAHDSENYVYTVTYTANAAKAEIIYVDETTGKRLETAVVDGKYNETINYSTADKIKYYESLGYELVKDGYVGGEFGEDTKTFYVTFKHGTVVVNPETPGKPDEPINPDNPDGPKYPADSANLNKDVTNTIHYVYADGTTAKPSHTQTLTFVGSGVIDKVTGQYVEVDENGNVKLDENSNPILGKLTWTASDGTTFIEVVSPTIVGYTPDKGIVNAVEGINQDSKNLETTVIYTANAAKAEIIYVDETTGKQLETAVVEGKYNETINYSTADKIKYYESLGYELVKDGYVGGEFGEDTKTFYVTFKHGTVTVTPDDKFTEEDPINPDNPDGPKYPFDSIALDKTITRTIKYVYADGTKAKDDVVQKLRFRGTAIIDKVTGEVIILDENGRKISDGIKWTALDGTTFIEVISPDIAGYTPDRKEIGSLENVDSNTDDIIETVVYNKDIVDPEEPKDPVDPEEPKDPVDPEEPKDPVDPEEPKDPVDPEEPKDPVDPEEPKDPVDPEEPKDPVDPEEPKDPVDSENPEDSKVPVQAETPTESPNDAPILPDQLSTNTTIKEVATVETKESGKAEAATTEDVSLPQTGHKHSNAGLIGLGLATIASILGLAGTRKRKKD
ncbi:MAG: YSIRK-type signal peptide-containing protein [Lactobacillus johnsonii]|nr:YSIRK-type signal peptide-containing protein [Lactobacillus johnsonii]